MRVKTMKIEDKYQRELSHSAPTASEQKCINIFSCYAILAGNNELHLREVKMTRLDTLLRMAMKFKKDSLCWQLSKL